jgi:hypothetical protein
MLYEIGLLFARYFVKPEEAEVEDEADSELVSTSEEP